MRLASRRGSGKKYGLAEYSPPVPAATRTVHPARGWFLIVLGFGLSGSMLDVANAIHAVIEFHDQSGGHSRWTDTREFTRTTLELFGVVFVFGLVTLAGG